MLPSLIENDVPVPRAIFAQNVNDPDMYWFAQKVGRDDEQTELMYWWQLFTLFVNELRNVNFIHSEHFGGCINRYLFLLIETFLIAIHLESFGSLRMMFSVINTLTVVSQVKKHFLGYLSLVSILTNLEILTMKFHN